MGKEDKNITVTRVTGDKLQYAELLRHFDYISLSAGGTVEAYYSSDYMRDFPTAIAENQTEADFNRMETVLRLREGFAPVQADFDRMVRDLKDRAKAAGDRLENLFAFCEEVFPEGQELLILVTELTVSYYAAAFIGRHGCPAYFAHNKELLFYERQQEIITQLEDLELK